MAATKPLYLASNLEELNKKVNKNDKMKQSNPKMLCRIADKLLLKAKDELMGGDEEQAYILYMRFIDIYKIIRSSKDYKKEKAEINRLLPTSKVNKALDSAELLSKTLKDRYSEMTSEPEASGSGSGEVHNNDQVVPSSPKPHPSTTVSQQPLLPLQAGPSELPLGSITPQGLYQMLTQQPEEVLVLDCRPRAEYNTSHPDTKKKFPQWLCVPEETIKNGVTDKAVMSFLSLAGKERWKGRGKVKSLVLVDDHSTVESLKGEGQTQPLLALKDALFKYNVGTPLTCDPYMLEGGYALWYLTYGVTCVGVYKRKVNDPSSATTGGGVSATPPKGGQEGTMDYPTFPEFEDDVVEGVASTETVIEMDEESSVENQATPMNWNSNTTPTQMDWNQALPTQMDWQQGSNFSSSSASMDAVVPPFVGVSGPLPPPPSTIPVVLALEGENNLIAPTLSSQNDLFSDYPQLLMTEEPEEEPVQLYNTAPAPVTTFTQPQPSVPQGQTVGSHYGSTMQQQVPQTVSSVSSSQSAPQLSQHQPPVQMQAMPIPMQALPPTGPNAGGQYQQVPRTLHPVHPPHNVGGSVQVLAAQSTMGGQTLPPQTSGGQVQQTLPPQDSGGQVQQAPHGAHMQNYGGQINQAASQGLYQQTPPSHQQAPPPQQHFQQAQPPQQQTTPPNQHTLAQWTLVQHPGSQPHPPADQPQVSAIQPLPPQVPATQPLPQQVSANHPQSQPVLPNQPLPQQVSANHPQSQPVPPNQPLPQQISANQPLPQPVPSNQPLPQQLPSNEPQQAPPTTSSPNVTQLPHNPRVAIGPMPHPPSYDQAQSLPSLPPVHPPLPPPISIPPEQLTQQNASASAVSSGGPHPTQEVPLPPPEGTGEVERVAMENLRKEAEELRMQMQSEISRFKIQQEEAAKKMKADQAELEAQRQSHMIAMQDERKELERMKKQFEKEVASMVIEKQRYLQLQEEEKKNSHERGVASQQHRELAQRAGLPTGWEKRLDHKTGRYYYMDHSTQTTHWNPPAHLINYQMQKQLQDEAARRQLRDEAARRQLQDEAARRQVQDEAARRQVQDEAARRQVQDEAARRQVQDEAARRQQEEMRLRQIQQNRATIPSSGSGQMVAAPAAGHMPAPAPSHMTPALRQTPHAQLIQPHPIPTSQAPPTSNQTTTPTLPATSSSSQLAPVPKPTVDRTVKPTQAPKPTVDRSNKPTQPRPPLWTPEDLRQKEANLQPAFGAERQLLTGLRNLGNTCFMNSTLQCLSHTSPVMPYFTSLAFQKDINYSNPIGHKGAVAKEFSWLMRALWSGRYKSVTPRDFKNMVDCYIPDMQGHAQQDAQEFLAFLMNELHEDLNRVRVRVNIEEPDGDEGKMARIAWSNHVKRNSSIIVDFFQGMYRSTVICNYCKKRSVTFEPFMYLSLPIPPGQRSYSLQDCLQLFSERETVSWTCSFCKHSSGAVKKLEIWKLPSILLIAFNRFTNDGLWKEKRQNYIDYPVGKSLLNLSGFVVGERPKVGYQLYAVSNHFGSQTGGHYTACCLNPYNQTYYNFDDHDVKEATAKQVKSGAGYLLFYTSLPHRAKF